MELGYNVSIPFGDCERYDFIVDVNGKLLKIQCKTAITKDDGASFIINGRSNMRKNGKIHHQTYNKKEIDYFATYFKQKCYVVPVEEVGSGKRLRLEASKNCQKERVNFAKDYEIEKIFKH